MDPHRQNAYRHLLYMAMLDIRVLCQSRGPASANPFEWWRAYPRSREAGALADWLHKLASFAARDFVGFDEARFWRERPHHIARLNEYERHFHQALAGQPGAGWGGRSWMGVGIVEALSSAPDIRFFRVLDSTGDSGTWQLVAEPGDVVLGIEGLYLIRAHQVRPDGSVRDIWMDLSLPERVSDSGHALEDGVLRSVALSSPEGEVISAVAVNAFGNYEMFYSRVRPDLGVATLRAALEGAPSKAAIAEDLGYILRDQGRHAEAAAAFRISVSEGPSSEFIHSELADCLRAIGDDAGAAEVQARFEKSDEYRSLSAWLPLRGKARWVGDLDELRKRDGHGT